MSPGSDCRYTVMTELASSMLKLLIWQKLHCLGIWYSRLYKYRQKFLWKVTMSKLFIFVQLLYGVLKTTDACTWLLNNSGTYIHVHVCLYAQCLLMLVCTNKIAKYHFNNKMHCTDQKEKDLPFWNRLYYYMVQFQPTLYTMEGSTFPFSFDSNLSLYHMAS